MRVTVLDVQELKRTRRRFGMLTAYDAWTARILDEAGVPLLLVGDSLGMVMLGQDDTLSVTVPQMVHHTRAVVNGSKRAMVVADLPFMSYQVSVAQCMRNAGRLIQKGGAQAVKLEGGQRVVDRVAAMTQAGIPVMGHLGLTPQSVNAFGGYKVQGKTVRAASDLLEDALRLQDAGVFAIVLECVPAAIAEHLTAALHVPTIGIGAGAGCDGQVLVTHDMLGLYGGHVPRFVKQFSTLKPTITEAVKGYLEAVEKQAFPAPEHTFSVDPAVLEVLRKGSG